MVVLLVILAMCICSIVIPSRFIAQMVNLGPLSNNAAYRRTLVKSCAHLARELVLNDGFSRMSQVASALSLSLSLYVYIYICIYIYPEPQTRNPKPET